jgi:DHA2 family multidrug resistance protein
MGPIVGGYICDNWGWSYIFYINIPVAIFCGLSARKLLADYETEILREKIDFGGLALLIVWVAALQFMLDEGKNYDWFESNFICMLLIIAVLGFIAFLIWELTQDKPIVDLSVFRHRGYFASVFTISLTFGAYFGSIVLTPLWLQNYMGYTATWSGCATAATGVLAVISAGFAAKFSQKFDLRKLVFCGVVWLGVLTFIRSFGNTDMTYFDIAVPMLIQGIGLPFFFVPLTGLALSSVNPNETASAAGLMNFLRTLSGAVATSIVTTAWEDNTNLFRSELVGKIESPKTVAALLGNENLGQQSVGILDQLVQTQAVMLATNRLFLLSACAFIFAASVIWIAKKPAQKADTSSAH